MKDLKQVRNGAKGPESVLEDVPKSERVLTPADIKKMVERDLPTCLRFLESLYNPDVVDAVVTVLHGQYLNHRHKEELSKQTEIKP